MWRFPPVSITPRQSSKALGLYPPRFLDLPDNRLDGVELLDIVKSVETVIAEVRPEVIYTNHANDLNIDHCIAAWINLLQTQAKKPKDIHDA